MAFFIFLFYISFYTRDVHNWNVSTNSKFDTKTIRNSPAMSFRRETEKISSKTCPCITSSVREHNQFLHKVLSILV